MLPACVPADSLETEIPDSSPTITLPVTGRATSSRTATLTHTPSPTVTATPSPVVHEVLLGDDMYSIAFLYGISPQQLMTANPDVNPRAMTVGMELLIPVTPTPPAAARTPTPTVTLSPTPTPRYRTLHAPDCYPDALGGLWCFVLIENSEDGALENVSALITLGEGEDARQEVAIMPLNLLPAGKSLPLVAYFQPPIAVGSPVSAEVDFLLPVMADDQRYLHMEIVDYSAAMNMDGRVATVVGMLELSTDQPDADYAWVNLTAFDAAGRIVAVRRWESATGMAAGSELSFKTMLYSLSDKIEWVDLVVEAQPIAPTEEE